MKTFSFALILLMFAVSAAFAQSQPTSSNARGTESEIDYHVVSLIPQYRFLNTSGYGGRVGEYDSLQQSVGGDFSIREVYFPGRMTLNSTSTFFTQDDYDSKTRLSFGKTFEFNFDSRSFIRHVDDNAFYANIVSPDIVRTDAIPADSLLGVRRRMNTARAKVQLPSLPIKLFVKGGWQSRDGLSQMQYYDMGGDTECGTCHAASQYRTLNYTTRNIAGGAEITLGRAKLVYQHEFRSFNDRMQSPSDFYGSTLSIPDDPLPPGVPDTLAGYYTHSLLSRHQTQDDSLQVTLAVAHHVTFNGDVNYARNRNLFTRNPQNSLNADATLSWNPIPKLRAIADFHQQNLLNDFIPAYPLYGDPSLHRHWADLKLQYRVTTQWEVESYYKRFNITRSNALLWPQIYSPNNSDPLMLVPSSFSNTLGAALRYHSKEFWNVRTGYEWIGTHSSGYVTDPGTSQRVFGDITLTPRHWLSFTNDASILLQRSFPVIQRSNHLYANTSFLSIKPVPQWTVGAGYTYLQDNLRTDMIFATDPSVGIYKQSLVPYKQLSQTVSFQSTYELKKRLAVTAGYTHSGAHSGFRPDTNAADFPGVDPAAVSAVALGAGAVSLINVPQAIIGSSANYHFANGFDSGLRFNYGSYTDYARPNLTGKLQSYTMFLGRTW